MSCLCIGPICIPYNAIWPFLLLALKPLWEWLQKLAGVAPKKSSSTSLPAATADAFTGGKEQSCCCTSTDKTAEMKKKSAAFPATHFELSQEQDLRAVISDSFTVVKMTASWCKPCKLIAPTFEALSRSEPYASSVHFVSVDVDAHEQLMTEHSVLALPTFLAFRGGKEHSRMSGADEDKLTEFIKAAFR
jgi:thiol-disulfide isomerase/thioredoxin